MSFKDCVDRAVAGKEGGKARAEAAKKAYDIYAENLPPDQAAQRVVGEAKAVAKSQQRRLEANARAQKAISEKIDQGQKLTQIVENLGGKGSLQGRHNA